MISEERAVSELKEVTGPEPLLWHIDTVAKLALARLPQLSLFEKRHGGRCDFAVATDDGLFVRVRVAAYSSRRGGISQIDSVPELRWTIPAELVRHARASITPVILLLIDMDTEHGRFARLDTLPAPPRGARSLTLGLPRSSTSSPANLERLIAELRARYQRPADSTAA